METTVERFVAAKIADNIVSPLGFTSAENYVAVKAGKSALCRYENKWNIPETFMASLIDRDAIEEECEKLHFCQRYTLFEKILILSVSNALKSSCIDVSSAKVLFILSTTKGNISLLDRNDHSGIPADRIVLGEAAKQVTDYFKNPNPPVVVSNACISGACAQIAAMRCLQIGQYDYVVVMGADCLSPFIISGFQSFKALSAEPCKPFDKDRNGLNLGEAAATIIYRKKELSSFPTDEWIACLGAIRNDANHISGPSRTGEGSYRALRAVLKQEGKEDLAFVNAHSTATVYNDEMEAVAIQRAGLQTVPVNGLKGYYGHTLGAAGILESIISMSAVDDNTILATRGYETPGVTVPLSIFNRNCPTDKRSFIKLLSGFGGCNAALFFKKGMAI
jgi:3-oxoacyl-[acyl-carrier-protein] synthase-1